MIIEAPDTDAADAIAECWVDLARDQRAHGSHLAADANRDTIRAAIVRDIISNGLLVAREEGEIVGFVMFGPETEQYTQDVSRGIVRNIVVRPAHRNEGIGSALLEAAEAALAEEGFDLVSLSVLAENDAARRFYARAGYDEHRIDLEKRLESDTDKPDRA